MKKYIVEAPELEGNQNVGAGGNRDNGKIVALFSNPVPYDEPELLEVNQRCWNGRESIKYQIADVAMGVGEDLISMLWYEYCRPLIQVKLCELRSRFVQRLAGSTQASARLKSPTLEAEEINEVDCVETSENDSTTGEAELVYFPLELVG